MPTQQGKPANVAPEFHPPAAAEPQWRTLTEGDILQSSDQFNDIRAGWVLTNRPGEVIAQIDTGWYRRRITPEPVASISDESRKLGNAITSTPESEPVCKYCGKVESEHDNQTRVIWCAPDALAVFTPAVAKEEAK